MFSLEKSKNHQQSKTAKTVAPSAFQIYCLLFFLGLLFSTHFYSQIHLSLWPEVPLVHGVGSKLHLSPSAAQPALPPLETSQNGILFRCEEGQIPRLKLQFDRYLKDLGISRSTFISVVELNSSPQLSTLNYKLAMPSPIGDTLNLVDEVRLGIIDALLYLPDSTGGRKAILTVSKKEIIYAMLQSGRTSTFAGKACDIRAVVDHVNIRQNIVAWSENLAWLWPDGDYAQWNEDYWKDGMPTSAHTLREAVHNAFEEKRSYSIGCYTAIKLVLIQAILDYFHRIKKDKGAVKTIEAVLLHDNRPVQNIEPGAIWYFEENITREELERPGKLANMLSSISKKNFVPGDWTYFLNTDPISSQKIGYEGSNTIYLGRGKFSDFYNDHHHFYTYKEKIDEVYQWRHQVFNERRDIEKIHPLQAGDYDRLGKTPESGGIALSSRIIPRLFGFE